MKNFISTTVFGLFLETVFLAKEALSQKKLDAYLKLLPEGEGKVVLLIPGFLNDHRVLTSIEQVLKKKGFIPKMWGLGVNVGHRGNIISDKLNTVLERFYDDHGPISIIGHSLGGAYANALAHENPHKVERIITLGGAHNASDHKAIHPLLLNLFQFIAQDTVEHAWEYAQAKGINKSPEDVPMFSIIGEQDQILNEKATQIIQIDNSLFGKAKVFTSHAGLLLSPEVMLIILDRLTHDLTDTIGWEKINVKEKYNFS